MKKENLPALEEHLNNYLKDVPEVIRVNSRRVDIDLSPEEVTPVFAKTLEKVVPFFYW